MALAVALRLSEKWRALKRHHEELMNEQRATELQSLKSQLNPHFLFNALEIINWQARMDQNDTVADMVGALSVLLSASLDRTERHLVPLEEELKVAEAYFLFIGLRFGEKLTVEKEIDPLALSCVLPRLAVQTLLENAVEHGIAPAGGGHIRLMIALDARLTLRVVNDGQPVTDEQLQKMRALLSENGGADGHVGLRNIAQRLRLLFGADAGITADRTQKGETVITISVKREACQKESSIDKPRQSLLSK